MYIHKAKAIFISNVKKKFVFFCIICIRVVTENLIALKVIKCKIRKRFIFFIRQVFRKNIVH